MNGKAFCLLDKIFLLVPHLPSGYLLPVSLSLLYYKHLLICIQSGLWSLSKKLFELNGFKSSTLLGVMIHFICQL